MKKIFLITILSITIAGCGFTSQKDDLNNQTYKPPISFFVDPLPALDELSKEYQIKIPSEDRDNAIKSYSEIKNLPYENAEKLLIEKGYISGEKTSWRIAFDSASKAEGTSKEELEKICQLDKIQVDYGKRCLLLKYSFCQTDLDILYEGNLFAEEMYIDKKMERRYIDKKDLDKCFNYYVLKKLDELSINGE